MLYIFLNNKHALIIIVNIIDADCYQAGPLFTINM